MYDVKLTPPELQHMPWFDNTKLTAVNTCPTYATLSYNMNKMMGFGGRALALEAGAICHEVFALVRMYDLLRYGPAWYERRGQTISTNMIADRGVKMFGRDRWNECDSYLFAGADDERTRLIRAAIYLLNTSGYYDEPTDRRRTLTNIEEACIVYIDNYPLNTYMPVVQGDFIGIEVPFDVLITRENDRPNVVCDDVARFVGKMDALCWDRMGQSIEVHENKTGSRIDETWCASYDMAHQVTGYCVAASAIVGQIINRATMWGLTLPQPRTTSLGGFMRHPVSRPPHMYANWFRWFWHTVELAQEAFTANDPTEIQKYTHSCSRYFRPCSFIPFCSSEPEEARLMLDEMQTRAWNPLHEEQGSAE